MLPIVVAQRKSLECNYIIFADVNFKNFSISRISRRIEFLFISLLPDQFGRSESVRYEIFLFNSQCVTDCRVYLSVGIF